MCEVDNFRLLKKVFIWDMKQRGPTWSRSFSTLCDGLSIHYTEQEMIPINMNLVYEKSKNYQENICNAAMLLRDLTGKKAQPNYHN